MIYWNVRRIRNIFPRRSPSNPNILQHFNNMVFLRNEKMSCRMLWERLFWHHHKSAAMSLSPRGNVLRWGECAIPEMVRSHGWPVNLSECWWFFLFLLDVAWKARSINGAIAWGDALQGDSENLKLSSIFQCDPHSTSDLKRKVSEISTPNWFFHLLPDFLAALPASQNRN